MIGQRLSHYEILAKIGEGGGGVVYKARDTRLDRFVAIKALNAATALDPERRLRFVHEAKAASALNHPGIVAVHDIATVDGADFIVMEFVDGMTLDQLIPPGGLQLSLALNFATQIANVLGKAHDAKIVHRDIKPSNVIVTRDGVVKVLDFGVAKLSIAGEDAIDGKATTHTRNLPPTGSGRVFGTLAYMSPEQAAGVSVDARSDIFSFGALLYEMVTGKPAFGGDSPTAILAAVMSSEPRPPSEVSRNVPQELERIIVRCLRKEPAKRFQAMADVAVELEEIRAETTAARAAAKGGRSHPWTARLSIAFALVALTIAAWALWPSPPLTPTIDRLTSYSGSERFPRFSPDGTQVVFAWEGANRDNIDLYISRVGEQASLRLTSNPAIDSIPAWSPSGDRIAFIRQLEGAASIFVTSPVPGSERKLIDFRPTSSLVYLMHLSWSADAKWLITDAHDGQGPSLTLVPVAEGEPRTLLGGSGRDRSYCYAEFSPSGRSIAFAQCKGKDGTIGDSDPCDIYVLALDEELKARGEPRQITQQAAVFRGIAWAADERSLIFASSFGGDMRLWRVDVAGGQPQRLEVAVQGEFPAISAAGRRLVYSHEDSNEWDIWKLEVNRPPFRVLSSMRAEHDPQLSPDGTRVAFTTDRGGRGREIWVTAVDGQGAVPVVQATGKGMGTPRWSPDGRRIAFDGQSEGDGNWDIYVVDAAGGQPRRVTNDPGYDNFPSWSRDGKSLYFRSMRSGSSQVWRMPMPTGTPVQVTTKGGASAWESWDGRTLYYTRHDGLSGQDREKTPALLSRPVAGGEEREVLPGVWQWDFFPVKEGVYYVTPVDPKQPDTFELRFLQQPTGQIRLLTTFQASIAQGLTASDDGSTILYSGRPLDLGADLILVQNFR